MKKCQHIFNRISIMALVCNLLVYLLVLESHSQVFVDSCFTSVAPGITFPASPDLWSGDSDLLEWNGASWIGGWGPANITLPPANGNVDCRAIFCGSSSLWYTGGEMFGFRIQDPMITGNLYSIPLTYVSHGFGSDGSFSPNVYTNSTPSLVGATSLGAFPAAGFSWTMNVFSFIADASQNGHNWIIIGTTPSGSSGLISSFCCGISSSCNMDLGPDTTICEGDNVVLDASIPNGMYLWSTGENTAQITVDTSGVYWVQVSSPTCVDADTIEVFVNSLPVVNLGVDTILCSGNSLELDAGSGFTSYLWSPSGNSQTYEVTVQGTYSVTVTDSNGCEGIDAMVVLVFDQMNADIQVAGPFCENNDPVQLLAADGGGVWLGNGVGATGLFSPVDAGTGIHSITYTILGNCGDSDSCNIIVFEVPEIDITQINESCINAEDGSVEIEISGGLAPYSILWSTGDSDSSITALHSGSYSVTVTDHNNCVNESMVNILPGTGNCNPPHVWVPNVFSPNGDGQNDELYVRSDGIEFIEFIIYDRWGEKIFETTNIENGWDGTYKGSVCPQSVYVWVLKFTWTESMKKDLMSGVVTIIE